MYLMKCLNARMETMGPILESAWKNKWPLDISISVEIPEDILKEVQRQAWAETEEARIAAMSPDDRLAHAAAQAEAGVLPADSALPAGAYEQCSNCKGEGAVDIKVDGERVDRVTCPKCKGHGVIGEPAAEVGEPGQEIVASQTCPEHGEVMYVFEPADSAELECPVCRGHTEESVDGHDTPVPFPRTSPEDDELVVETCDDHDQAEKDIAAPKTTEVVPSELGDE